MSFYSSGSVKTIYLDPKSFVDGRRAVFELDGHHMAYLPNMRILDVGVFGQAGGKYNEFVGVNALIKEVGLFDGKTKLSEAREYALYRGFQLQNVKNAKSASVTSIKNINQLGYQQLKGGQAQYLGIQDETAAARNDSKGGEVDLREVLPMLSAVTHLPTDLMPNLRLEVVFDTSVLRQVLMNDTHTIAGQLIPVLAVDVLDDKPIVDKLTRALGKGIQWLEIEHDQVLFKAFAQDGGAADQAVVQEVNFKLDGFKGKSVERLLQVKEIADPAKTINANVVQGYGRYASQAVLNEKIQYRLNGRNILPDAGAVNSAERLGYVVDTYGDCFAYPGSNSVDIDPTDVVSFGAAAGSVIGGALSYNGIYIGEKVMDLQVQQSRTGLEDTTNLRPSTDALNLHFYGEVKKGLVVQKNGSYLVVNL